MNSQPNPRIVGACLVGFALVAGAYVIGNFGEPRMTAPVPGSANLATVRTPITVVDSDRNGIEDWRDEFVTTAPIIIDPEDTTPYEEPDTLTGQLGINFFQNIIYSRGYGEFGRSEEEVISDTIDILTRETAHTLYDTPDITIIERWSDEDIRNYANGLALAILNNDIPELDGELNILDDILTKDETDRVTELNTLARVYEQTRDDTLALAVPGFLAKEHLDLINSYHAIHKDIEAMTKSIDDPAYSFLRLKRYDDDALGLGYALQNMYRSVEPHARLFSEDDPALLFVLFSPSNFTLE